MKSPLFPLIVCALVSLAAASGGCMSPYHTDRGMAFGGLAGAGVGALVGSAVGDPLAGAAIGAGVGAVSGAAVGSSLDEMEARNRALIESRLGRPVPAGAVSMNDVIAMTQAGVDEQIIISHLQIHGVTHPPQSGELIHLQNNGVSPRVMQAMQAPPVGPSSAPQMVAVAPPPPPPMVVYDPWYDPWWGPPPPPMYYRRRFGPMRPPRGPSFGVMISGGR